MLWVKKSAVLAVSLLLLAAAAGCGGGERDDGHAGHEQETAASANAVHDADHGGDEQPGEGGQAGGDHGGAHGSHGGEATAYELEWTYEPEQPKSGEPVSIRTQVYDAEGKTVEQFELSHEKLMHLIVVSEDLSVFQHLHPDKLDSGQFAVETRLPQAGGYKLFADFVPEGGSDMTAVARLRVEGEQAEPHKLVPDEKLEQTVNGIDVRLNLSSNKAGESSELTFTFADADTKEPVTDLEPYLGAMGHTVIVSEDSERYLHVHPVTEDGGGPEAKFATEFPERGIYKIWGQFQRSGETFIVPYVVNID